jgi:hypothetical protein
MAVTVKRECDMCGNEPAYETTFTVARTIPPEGKPSKSNKAKQDKYTEIPMGDLCDSCTDRWAITIDNLIGEVRVGSVPLAKVPSADDPESPESADQAEDQPAEHQPYLPLGGTDGDSGSNAEEESPLPSSVKIADGDSAIPDEPSHSGRTHDRTPHAPNRKRDRREAAV